MKYGMLALLLAIALNILTKYLRDKGYLIYGDVLYDILPFMSGWWSCLIFSLGDKK